MSNTTEKCSVWQWPDQEFLNTELDQEQVLIYDILKSLLGDLREKNILEPGCGTGKIGHRFVLDEAQVTLCDLSENAVRGLQLRFKSDRRPAILKGDIRSIPFKSDIFDLVWNSGVMEHFSDEELIGGLREMARVSRRYVAVFVPFKDCFPYKIAKMISEHDGTWEWGLERPKRTLRDAFQHAGIDVIEEFDFGHCTNIPLSYLNLLPIHIAEELQRDYLVRSHFYCGVSLATIGVKVL
jgi:SAM-dependent methyltransferase